ncbi:MAG TPA: ATP-dependent Clp protease ATP-binding subunit [Verrucomicrobiae bacterium]|nr:ATP-dependent Clp protease ATP-binding subunit [Verrucomicrobiae bacterium]
MEVKFNYSSLRARKARFARKLTKPVRVSAALLMLLLILGGAGMLLYSMAVGWLLLGVSSLGVMLLFWWKHELQAIPPDPKGQSIDAFLDSELLGLLPERPTPNSVAEAAMQASGGHFMIARFGLGPAFLQHFAAEDPGQMQAIWQKAMALKQQFATAGISTPMIAVSLLQASPEATNLLAHMQLDEADVIDGVRWYHHVQDLINKHKTPRRTGGIARDWSFGFTPYLARFGVNVSTNIARGGLLSVQLEAHDQALAQMLDVFSTGGRQNVALVGPAGSGKTTIVHAFAELLLDGAAHIPANLRYHQVISLDAAALIASAPGRGELEQLVNQLLVEAYKAKNIIICLDDAQLFFEEGVGSVDISNVLLPILEGRALRIILTMDEQRWLQISQRNPALANALNRVTIAPATKEETLRVLQDHLIVLEFQHKVTVMYQALLEAYRLSERYIHELAMPGRSLKLLEAATSYADDGLVSAPSVQAAIEKTYNIKVGVANTSEERERLLNMEQLIHQRMINQTRAVNVVSNALRRARAGVRNQNRPIGTFLFLGPTGVGKTELSKALADVYFGGENQLVRLDLNEYVGPGDVARLIADGAEDPHSLTAQVLKQPFSVVLLDEIEKAHPNVLATLLQLLDEGILRDVRNREVSFRDAIIIATSNAGADTIREYIDAGYELEQFEEPFINQLITSQAFRPEFLNRFDEIVVFRPLTKDELLQVVDLILVGVNKNLALQKMSITVSEEAKRYLVDAGYDPRLGARPMRRIVQRTVENLFAKRMLAGQVAPGEVIAVSLDDVKEALKQ